MVRSAFQDTHKGRKFVIRFVDHQNGYTVRVEVSGLPPIDDSDNVWADREEAKAAGINIARVMIDRTQ